MAIRKKKKMYVILTNHYFKVGEEYKQILGYGVMSDAGNRIRKYSNTSGGQQEFAKIWYTANYEVMEIERILKQRLASDTHIINGEEVEWISPHSDITIDELIRMIEEIAKEINKPLYAVKKDFLPFKDSEWQRDLTVENIETFPEKYLEVTKGFIFSKPKEKTVDKKVSKKVKKAKKKKSKKPDILRRK